MSEFINTIDLQGDQETLDALVSNTQTEYSDNSLRVLCNHALRSRTLLTKVDLLNVTSIGQYAFSDCTGLEKVNLPHVTATQTSAFSRCYRTTSFNLPELNDVGSSTFSGSSAGIVALPEATNTSTYIANNYGASGFDFSKLSTIKANAFRGERLTTIILRGDTMCTLANISAFTDTPLRDGYGWIYVPSDLVNTYKGASNWSALASRIVSLGEYPKEYDGGTITDTWSEIFAAESDGTYSTKYSVGDTKALNWNGACVIMKIVGLDVDDLSSNSGKAKITWMSVGIIKKIYMNETNGNAGGWTNSALRSYMNNEVFSTIDSAVRMEIKPVIKKSYDYTTGMDLTTEDYVWIPSFYEVTKGNTSFEQSGVFYSYFASGYSSNASRRISKSPCGNQTYETWWLRTSTKTSGQFKYISINGSASEDNAYSERGVILCFCT